MFVLVQCIMISRIYSMQFQDEGCCFEVTGYGCDVVRNPGDSHLLRGCVCPQREDTHHHGT